MLTDVLSTLTLGLISFLCTTQGLISVSVVAVAVWLYSFTKCVRSLPPGPKPWPLVGNLKELKNSSLAVYTHNLSKKYGPVFTIFLGWRPAIVIATIEAATEACVVRGDDFADKPTLVSTGVIGDSGSDVAFAALSDATKYRRKVVMQSLRQYMTGSQHIDRVHSVVEETITNIQSHEGAFLLEDHTFFAIFNVLHTLCFGNTLPMRSRTYRELADFFQRTSASFSSMFLEDEFPILRHLNMTRLRNLKLDMKFFHEYLDKHIAGSSDKCNDGVSMTSLVDHILSTKQKLDDGDSPELQAGFTSRHVRSLLTDVFFAGIDSSSHTLRWIFLVLALKQDVQKKIQKEIDDVVGRGVPSRDNRAGLLYTEAVIMEVMRLYPVVPMGVPHMTYRATQVSTQPLPGGTFVMFNLYAIMRDPAHWENPDSFMPERFFSEDQSSLTKPKSWIPFGTGQRSCVGEQLARVNLLYIVTGLLQRLTFTFPPDDVRPDLSTPPDWFNRPCPPFKVIATPRS